MLRVCVGPQEWLSRWSGELRHCEVGGVQVAGREVSRAQRPGVGGVEIRQM